MADLYDKDGEIVAGAMTKEEIDAATLAAVEAAKTAAVEEYKAANPGETAEEKAAREAKEKAAPVEKTPAEIATEAATAAATAAVAAALRTRDIQDMAKLYAPGDTEKQKLIIENATTKVQGFENNADGLVQQMEAAASMAGIDVSGVDISSLSGTGGNRNVDAKAGRAPTGDDAAIQAALGIKPEDAEKYGKGE